MQLVMRVKDKSDFIDVDKSEIGIYKHRYRIPF